MSTKPTPVQLYAPLCNRNAGLLRDARIYNGYVEKEGDDLWTYKRPGFQLYATVGAPGDVGQGVFNWLGDVYSIFADKLYKNGVLLGSVTGSGLFSFSSTRGGTPRLTMKTTTTLWSYDSSNGLVDLSASTNYPNPTVPGIAYIDGYTTVFDTKDNIWTSNTNDPSTWGGADFLVAQIEPDGAVAIAKQLVYIIALKGISTEVFWDAGNASGSPLAPILGSKVNVGCRNASTVRDLGGDLYWIGSTRAGHTQAMEMTAARGVRVSTPPVDRLLDKLDFSSGSSVFSWSVAVCGHSFYGVTSKNSNMTLVYDATTKSWFPWTDPHGNYIPIVDSTYDSSANPVFQHESNGKLYRMNIDTDAGTGIYADDSVAYPFDIYTGNYSGGLRVNKTVGNIEVIGDEVDSDISISWSDDDQKTFTNPVIVNMNQPRPILNDGSTFRRRTYRLYNLDANFLRLARLDLTASPGTF